MWFRSYSYLASQRTLCTPGSYTITNIVNMSFSSGNFHYTLKESVISPLLNKSTLDKDELSNYRPISNLSLISKIIERVVKSRLSDHFISNNLVVNPHQSAYCKHHSTETALLCIHDHLINAIGWLKNLSLPSRSAFDTTDHNVLLTRLSSWFGIHGTALNWFRSYLSSRCFRVKCNNDFSSPHTWLYVSPKAQFSALCSLSCILPHSVLLFHLFLLITTCTQMTHNFSSPSIHQISTPTSSHLINALQQISSWMTANLLTLNSSKTEFLLIGLKQRLSKIQDCSLTTTNSARNLGFIFDEHLTFSDQITALSQFATITSVNFAVSAHTLTSKQPAPLPPPLNLTTVTLS